MMEQLHTGRIFGLSILAGLISGGILAGVNMTLVQPLTDLLAGNEVDNQLAEGEFFEDEFEAHLQSVTALQQFGSIAIGLAGGTLLGAVSVISRIKRPPVKTALLIAGIAWFVLYMVPAVKYPPSPEAMFDPEAGRGYTLLFASYVAVSGLAALGIAMSFRKVRRKDKVYGAAAFYLVVIAIAFFAFPDYQSEDDTFVSQQILGAWRSAISLSITIFWFALGIMCGLLWKYGTKNTAKQVSRASP